MRSLEDIRANLDSKHFTPEPREWWVHDLRNLVAEVERLRAQVDAMGYRLAKQRLDEAANNARYGYGGII